MYIVRVSFKLMYHCSIRGPFCQAKRHENHYSKMVHLRKTSFVESGITAGIAMIMWFHILNSITFWKILFNAAIFEQFFSQRGISRIWINLVSHTFFVLKYIPRKKILVNRSFQFFSHKISIDDQLYSSTSSGKKNHQKWLFLVSMDW